MALAQPNEPEPTPAATARDASDGALAAGLARALRPRRANVVPVDQPLALICQAQRSGGTLLARLFDGHPQCHVHPYELQIGFPKPHIWPQLALDEEPAIWFAKLHESYLDSQFLKGRRTIPLKAPRREGEGQLSVRDAPCFPALAFSG